ncbi:MAG: hypothetical protein OFPI_13420 [Osedax symbiont Rs2]|nr:MAG: hypothetical protein OFPI_13420 [Osedax symbiont Rs2]
MYTEQYTKGLRNSIADVPGISVGHCTLDNAEIQTGVTALLPHQGNCFENKCVAAVEVINGFGKSVGLMQVAELETPILLTNTLSVGTASDTLIKYMLKDNLQIGAQGTVNPLVLECNDGYLNDIRGQHVKPENVFAAIENASADFLQGSVGAGRGMSAYKLKGGIGSASRLLHKDGSDYCIGSLVLSNMGRLKDFSHYSCELEHKLQQQLAKRLSELEGADSGSIIMIIATDLPLDARQLKRLAKRSVVALAKTGSQLGTGSGDICLAFSTANQISHTQEVLSEVLRYPENQIDLVFDTAIESLQQAIINSMLNAQTVQGHQQHCRISLKELI